MTFAACNIHGAHFPAFCFNRLSYTLAVPVNAVADNRKRWIMQGVLMSTQSFEPKGEFCEFRRGSVLLFIRKGLSTSVQALADSTETTKT